MAILVCLPELVPQKQAASSKLVHQNKSNKRKALPPQRQLPHGLARRCLNRIQHRWRHHTNRRLAHPAPEVLGRHDHRIHLGHLRQSQDGIGVKVQLLHSALIQRDLSIESRAQAIGH